MADGEGFAIEPNMHFASELEDRIQSEDLASLQIAAVQDTFAEMSGHKCCQADWSMGRWVDGSMQWSFMSNFSGPFIGLLDASSQLRRHARAGRKTLKNRD